MSEKRDLRSLNRVELVEILQRQEKLLANKKFLQTLPDKGAKINQVVEKLRMMITAKKEVEDLSSRFHAIQLSGPARLHQEKEELDSDDDDDEIENAIAEQASKPPVTQTEEKLQSSSSQKPVKSSASGKWDYDSAVTHSHFYKCEKAKTIPIEESAKLQQDQIKRHEKLLAEQATKRLQEQMGQQNDSKRSNYKFSSRESKYQYRDVNIDEGLRWDPEDEKASGKDSDSDVED